MALTEGDFFVEGQSLGYGFPKKDSEGYDLDDLLIALEDALHNVPRKFQQDFEDGFKSGRVARNA